MGGSFERAHITMTRGVYLADTGTSAEQILEQWNRIGDRAGELLPSAGPEQSQYEAARARENGSA